jgi:flagellar basal-body rod protein FlgB
MQSSKKASRPLPRGNEVTEMLNRLDDMLNFHAQALRLRDQRQQVLASNIANADTPDYKARDFDFSTALTSALGGQTAPGGATLATTAAGHLAGSAALSTQSFLQYRQPAQGNVDGNTVDVDAERAAFAENAVQYEFNLTRVSSQIKSMLAVIQG